MKTFKDITGKKVKEEKPCWDGYVQIGMKNKDGKQVPNCVPEGVAEARKWKLENKNIDEALSLSYKNPYLKSKSSDLTRKKQAFLKQIDDLIKSKKVTSKHPEVVDLQLKVKQINFVLGK